MHSWEDLSPPSTTARISTKVGVRCTLIAAVVWASVAASFVVEQDGLPSMTKILGREVWNGDYPWERVDALKKKREMAEN